jgi:hypothetical protein
MTPGWDDKIYLGIIQYGYDQHPDLQGYANYAFFPLYPLIVKLFTLSTHIPAVISGQLLSNLFLLLSLKLFYDLTKIYYDELTARYAALLLAISPFNIYFVSIYTESLFLFLCLGCWHAALKREWYWAGLIGALMSATRPTGILIILPMLWFIIDDYRMHKKFSKNYLWILLMPLGLLTFMAYLGHHVGDPFAFKHIQTAWGRTGWHLAHIYIQFRDQYHLLKYDFWMLLFGFFLTYQLYRTGFKKEALFLLLLFLPALNGGVFDSLGRYIGASFPFYLALTSLSARKNNLMMITLILEASFLSALILGWIGFINYFS